MVWIYHSVGTGKNNPYRYSKKIPKITEFDCAVFDGHYVTEGIDTEYLKRLEQSRNDTAKKKKDGYIDVNVDAASVDLTGIKEDA